MSHEPSSSDTSPLLQHLIHAKQQELDLLVSSLRKLSTRLRRAASPRTRRFTPMTAENRGQRDAHPRDFVLPAHSALFRPDLLQQLQAHVSPVDESSSPSRSANPSLRSRHEQLGKLLLRQYQELMRLSGQSFSFTAEDLINPLTTQLERNLYLKTLTNKQSRLSLVGQSVQETLSHLEVLQEEYNRLSQQLDKEPQGSRTPAYDPKRRLSSAPFRINKSEIEALFQSQAPEMYRVLFTGGRLDEHLRVLDPQNPNEPRPLTSQEKESLQRYLRFVLDHKIYALSRPKYPLFNVRFAYKELGQQVAQDPGAVRSVAEEMLEESDPEFLGFLKQELHDQVEALLDDLPSWERLTKQAPDSSEPSFSRLIKIRLRHAYSEHHYETLLSLISQAPSALELQVVLQRLARHAQQQLEATQAAVGEFGQEHRQRHLDFNHEVASLMRAFQTQYKQIQQSKGLPTNGNDVPSYAIWFEKPTNS
jgi:hypothetical protein